MPDITIAAVLDKPEEFGITFVNSTVSKGTGAAKVTVGVAPLLTVVNLLLFEAAFPGVILKHADGQSVKVHAQAITRGMLVKHNGASVADMKVAQIKGICFGQVATSSVRTVTVEKIVEVSFSTEKRAALIAELVDRGLDVATAQEIAAKM